ncbi:MAG TPA: family 78 glycoside hydrolase catalytic domain [bacterium]|nr:family 78 glycoside hydrolase catalytic domain [bacterium]
MRNGILLASSTMLLCCACATTLTEAAGRSSIPARLLCEYLDNPLAVEESTPRLFWQIPKQIKKQTAYQVLVTSDLNLLNENQADAWDSGRVESDQSIQVPYGGKTLESERRYYWKVRVWGDSPEPSEYSQPAFWQMGLLHPSDWKAKWIALPGLLPGNVPAHLGYHSKLESSPNHQKWIQIGLKDQTEFDTVRIYPVQAFRDIKQEGFLFPIRFRLDVSNDSAFFNCRTVLDLTKEDQPSPGNAVQVYKFSKESARYVRLTVTRLAQRDENNYGFALAEMEVLSGDKVLSTGCRATALDTIESDPWSVEHIADGVKVSREIAFAPPSPSPMLRKEFEIPYEVQRATVYTSALGLYEMRINGNRVGKNILAPEWTDYDERVQYQAYDVTELLRPGSNAVAAVLGEGWYAGLVGLMSPRQYGYQLGWICQLEITGTDGRQITVISDSSWKVTNQGPIRAADIIRGETMDARRDMRGWDLPGFDDGAWTEVEVLKPLYTKLTAQPNEPIQITRELSPVAVTEPKPGVYVFDFGQNLVGWCRMKIRGREGQEIRLHHAEVLNPDGMVYTENLRENNQRDPVKRYQADLYICGGEQEETFEPHFTYHGFRYVELRGLEKPPALGDLTACVIHSSAPIAGRFECSEPMLNRLMENIVWTQRGNMHSTPTDCPQRDERLGWMGDAQIFSQAACFNMNMAGFFTKWCRDIREAQADNGAYSDFSPNPLKKNNQFLASPGWADAGVIVPWRVYTNYGDIRILERHYDSAKRWVEYVRDHSTDLIWTSGRGNDYGDWLNGDTMVLENWPRTGSDTPREIYSTAFFACSSDILSKMAAVLGNSKDAQEYSNLAGEIRQSFVRHYVKEDGRIESDTQAVYALALHFDLLPENLRPAALEHLVRKIGEYNNHVATGIQSTNRMMMELADRGHTDLAYQLLNNRTIPSWGYQIEKGATTIWERWDGWVEGRGFQERGMNSFNHYAIGAVGEWMYRNILGINPDLENPGYRHFFLRPRPGDGLTWARGKVETLYGDVVSSWKMANGDLMYECSVPPNTKATLVLPSSSLESTLQFRRGVPKSIDPTPSAFVVSLEPGDYSVQMKSPVPEH